MLFFCAFFFFFQSARFFFPFFKKVLFSLSFDFHQKKIHQVLLDLNKIRSLLLSGQIPSHAEWSALLELEDPWGSVLYDAFQGLRDAGASVLPTLKRFEQLAYRHQQSLQEAAMQSSQAFYQAMVCALLPLVFGGILFFLLPELQKDAFSWGLVCFFSFAFCLIAALWVMQIALSARWGGLKGKDRFWHLLGFCGVERLLACIRCSMPVDTAWEQTYLFLEKQNADFAQVWGSSLWVNQDFSHVGMKKILSDFVMGTKKSLLSCLMQGIASVPRIEQLSLALQTEIDIFLKKTVHLVSSHALKPLFLIVLPAILSLVGFALLLVIGNERL